MVFKGKVEKDEKGFLIRLTEDQDVEVKVGEEVFIKTRDEMFEEAIKSCFENHGRTLKKLSEL